jgi:hypothetical protein
MFFQVHKDGLAIDGTSYSSLEEASEALEKTERGGEVTEVDRSDRIIRRYTLQESRSAARRFRHESSEKPPFEALSPPGKNRK